MTTTSTEVALPAAPAGPSLPTLTGPQKVAVLLMQMGREASAQILSQLREAEVEEIAAEIVRMRSVSPDVADDVLREFQETMYSGRNSSGGGVDVAHDLLSATFGAAHADEVIDRLAQAHAKDPFSFLADAEPRTLMSFLNGEHPQIVAVVLAHLQLDQSSVIMSGLPPELQAEVAHRIGVMERTNPEMVRIIAETLERQTSSVLTTGRSATVVGGVQPLVDLINRADPATERIILESLEKRDAKLAEAVRSKLFVFDDITTLEDRGVQLVLRQVESGDLAIALKGVSDVVRDKVLGNVSERARDTLLEEIDLLGPQRVSAVEESRAKIVQVIRSLEETGQIVLRRGGDDDFVD